MRMNKDFFAAAALGALLMWLVCTTLNSIENRLSNLWREVWELKEEKHEAVTKEN